MNFGEQLVGSALESLGYFIIQGYKVGVREADFLAIKREGTEFRFFHIEAQISWKPSGVLRAQARYGDSAKNWKQAAKDYVKKKFLHKDLVSAITKVFGTNKYQRILIYGKLKESKQLSIIEKEGIQCLFVGDLVDDAATKGEMTGLFTEMYNITSFKS